MKKTKDQSLHSMLDAYSNQIKSQKLRQAAQNADRLSLVRRLKEAHADVPIASLNQHEVQAMIDHWRFRPAAKNASRPIAVATATKRISELRRFLLWLHDTPLNQWSLQFDFHRLNLRPTRLASDTFRIPSRQVYSIDELRLLYQKAAGMERPAILLGLNCGFGTAEMGRLRVEDLHLQNQSRRPVTDKFDSVLIFCRPRTHQVGIWPLWPETVEAFEVVLKARCGNKNLVFQTQDGRPLYRDNERNPRVLFTNLWRRLTNRVKEHHPEFPSLPIGSLRMKVADLLRKHCSGDVVSAFLGHAPQSQSCAYYSSNRRSVATACVYLRDTIGLQEHVEVADE